tara:strand:+ start:14232 stop:14516 length:285 start_codon:yes stop_codon:yes gene_type:complete
MLPSQSICIPEKFKSISGFSKATGTTTEGQSWPEASYIETHTFQAFKACQTAIYHHDSLKDHKNNKIPTVRLAIFSSHTVIIFPGWILVAPKGF